MSTIKYLTPEETSRVQGALLQRESSGNYQAVNRLGYIGGYQMGAPALEDIGLLKKGASKGGNAALDNPDNWTIPGGKQAFLNDPALQDQSFIKLANRNVSTLERTGVISGGTDSADVAGYVGAAHLTGPGGAINLSKGIISNDANGVKSSEYFGLTKSASQGLSGVPTKLPDPAAATGAVATATAGKIPGITPAAVYQPKGFTPLSGNTQTIGVSVVSGKIDTYDIQLPIQNPLEKFNSFNCIFTLSCLTDTDVNFPDYSYKADRIGNVILRSGGGFPDMRVETLFGKFEFYIDNVEIDTVMAYNPKSQNTNATGIRFEVTEPYSMGMFLQSMQIGALNAGHKNYLEAPFLLTLQFIGHTPDGQTGAIENTTRHFPLKLQDIGMEVTQGGCKYAVSAYPWNEQALNDVHNLFQSDIAISGDSVYKMLQSGERSLQYVVNSRLTELASKEEKKPIADEIVIIFPKELNSNTQGSAPTQEGSAVVDPNAQTGNNAVVNKLTLTRGDNKTLLQAEGDLNEIGNSSMGFTASHGGNQPTPKDAEAYDPATGIYKRKGITINPKDREFKFSQGTSITNAITQVILMSDFARAIVEDKKDENKMYTWFRIETQVFNMEPNEGNEKLKGRKPKLLIFKVVPYKVHPMRFARPNTTPPGYEQLRKNAAKHYNYLYTGKNTDILNFDIKLASAFYTAYASDKGALNKDTQTQNQSAMGGKPTSEKTLAQGAGDTQVGDNPTRQEASNPAGVTDKKGGGGADDHKTRVARTFQEALLNSPADMLTVNMTIMGDPYYIADSGMGNWSNVETGKFNVTETGAVNYQSGEVDILVNFRTPIDIDPSTGYMNFGETKLVDSFSGLYQITEVKNLFQSGKFTQELSLIRRREQEKASAGAPQASTGTGAGATTTESTANSATVSPSSANADALSPGQENIGAYESANPDNKVNTTRDT